MSSLDGVEIDQEDEDAALLRIVGNSASHGWGTAGSNGAQVTMTAADMVLTGDIIVDTISTLDLTISDGTVLSK